VLDLCKPGTADAIGEKTVMPDAVKSVGQAMQQEPPDELVGLQGHVAWRVAMAIILPAEGHAGVVSMHQSAAGDGDAVGIAAKIGQHVSG